MLYTSGQQEINAGNVDKMGKIKYKGPLFRIDTEWPPNLDELILKTARNFKICPKFCLFHPEMPEIVPGKYKITIIRDACVRPNHVWLVLPFDEYDKERNQPPCE